MRLDQLTTMHDASYKKLSELGFENSSDSRDLSAHLSDGRLNIWVNQDLPEDREPNLVQCEKYCVCIDAIFDNNGDSCQPLVQTDYINDVIEKITDYYIELRDSNFKDYRDNLIKEISKHPNILGDSDGSIYYEMGNYKEGHYTFCYCTPLWDVDHFIDTLSLEFHDRDGEHIKQVVTKYKLTKDLKKDTENFFKILYREI